MKEYIVDNIKESLDAKKRILENEGLISTIEKVAEACVEAYISGHKVLACGNGGSASDALHMVGELVGRYKMERRGIAAVALNSNVAVMTALGNDYDYDSIYAKQVIALGNSGDVLFAISTSGNSKNIISACNAAKNKGIIVVGMTGEKGGMLGTACDFCLNVPSENTARIQEMHILLIHTICGIIEKELYSRGYFEE